MRLSIHLLRARERKFIQRTKFSLSAHLRVVSMLYYLTVCVLMD